MNNHGTLTGNQAIVVWAIKRPEEKPVLNPQSGSFDFDDFFSPIADESKALHDDISDALNATNVQYAKIFSRVLRGYEGAEDLKKHNDPMVVVILDAATTGRLGVTFYCELQKDEYIKRILQWHVDAAWPLTFFKKSIVEGAERVNVVQYEGAPSFTDIINCACGTSDRSSKSYKRFAKDVKERLIECMFGGAQFPMSILNAACHKVTRPMGYDNIRVWRRDFEIACSLWKKHYIDETRKQHRQEDVITMYLEPNRDDRDYLYGRLLALADNFEESVLRKQGVKDRPTNAIKLMSNFTAKPIRRGAHCGSSLCHTLNRQTVVPGSVMRSMMLWLCLRKVILKIIRRFRQCFFWDIHVSGEHLSVKRKRFLKKIIATTDFCNYQSRFIAYK